MTIEIDRYFKSVKAFYNYCEKMCTKKGMDIHDWMESLEQFKNPIQRSNSRNNEETCVLQPYNFHLYFKNSYNFIMEFDFYTENEGFGYLYIKE